MNRRDLDPFERRLLERLRDHVAARGAAVATSPAGPRPRPQPSRRGRWSPRSARSLTGLGALVVAAVVLVLVLLSSGSSPAPALAFPILKEPLVQLPISPAKVAFFVRGQTTNLQGGPVNTHLGRRFQTPWGPGYLITDQRQQIACVLIDPWRLGWTVPGCVGPQTASHEGLNGSLYWHRYPHTAVDVAVMDAGSTMTAQQPGVPPRRVALHDGVAVTVIHHTTVFTTHINGHTHHSVAWLPPGAGWWVPTPAWQRRWVRRIDPGAFS